MGGLGTDFDLDGGLTVAIAHSLRAEGFDASEDGTGLGTPIVPVHVVNGNSTPETMCECAFPLRANDGSGNRQAIAFTSKDHGAAATIDLSPTLQAGGSTTSHANAGVMPAVAFDLRGREGGAQFEGPHDTANIRAASGGSSRSYVAQQWAVRRLTPKECERLQGVPDNWTMIPWRGKPADQCPDGNRYKALGNSWAVPVVRWIGERIDRQLRQISQSPSEGAQTRSFQVSDERPHDPSET